MLLYILLILSTYVAHSESACEPGKIHGSCMKVKDDKFQIRGVKVQPMMQFLLNGYDLRRKQTSDSKLHYVPPSEEVEVTTRSGRSKVVDSELKRDKAKSRGTKTLEYNLDPIDSFERAVVGDEFETLPAFSFARETEDQRQHLKRAFVPETLPRVEHETHHVPSTTHPLPAPILKETKHAIFRDPSRASFPSNINSPINTLSPQQNGQFHAPSSHPVPPPRPPPPAAIMPPVPIRTTTTMHLTTHQTATVNPINQKPRIIATTNDTINASSRIPNISNDLSNGLRPEMQNLRNVSATAPSKSQKIMERLMQGGTDKPRIIDFSGRMDTTLVTESVNEISGKPDTVDVEFGDHSDSEDVVPRDTTERRKGKKKRKRIEEEYDDTDAKPTKNNRKTSRRRKTSKPDLHSSTDGSYPTAPPGYGQEETELDTQEVKQQGEEATQSQLTANLMKNKNYVTSKKKKTTAKVKTQKKKISEKETSDEDYSSFDEDDLGDGLDLDNYEEGDEEEKPLKASRKKATKEKQNKRKLKKEKKVEEVDEVAEEDEEEANGLTEKAPGTADKAHGSVEKATLVRTKEEKNKKLEKALKIKKIKPNSELKGTIRDKKKGKQMVKTKKNRPVPDENETEETDHAEENEEKEEKTEEGDEESEEQKEGDEEGEEKEEEDEDEEEETEEEFAKRIASDDDDIDEEFSNEEDSDEEDSKQDNTPEGLVIPESTIAGESSHIDRSIKTPYSDQKPSKFYYPPKSEVPLPTCFHNPSGYVCCNLMLNNLVEESVEEVKTDPDFNMCNIGKIANMIQSKSEEMFEHPFESVVALGDFAQTVHFAGDLVCKLEIDGKFMLVYGTPYDADSLQDEEEKENSNESSETTRKRKIRRKKSLPIHSLRM